jgi:hypothetical protein
VTQIVPEIVDEARRLLDLIADQELDARLIGGMAVRLLAADDLDAAFIRDIADLDFVVSKRDARRLAALLEGAGYQGDEQFNALNGARRLLYLDRVNRRQIDVFVQTFVMCHELPIVQRLGDRADTLPAAEVLMTKLQIISLNAKDRGDLYAILATHDVAAHDDRAINAPRIASLASDDWGLQHTFELNLQRLRDGLPDLPLEAEAVATIAQRIDALATAIEVAPKSRKWKLRARIGERKQWYEEPEEVDRDISRPGHPSSTTTEDL